MTKCAVIGAKGYTGCEIIKILAKHPEVEITFLGDIHEESVPLADFLPSVITKKSLCIEKTDIDKIINLCDVIFLALPHTISIDDVEKMSGKGKLIIDLSADYRFKSSQT